MEVPSNAEDRSSLAAGPWAWLDLVCQVVQQPFPAEHPSKIDPKAASVPAARTSNSATPIPADELASNAQSEPVTPSVQRQEVAARYQEWGREFWAILYARCWDRELALEAVQEAFLRWQSQPPDQPPNDPVQLRAWLLRVACNWLVDHQRRQRPWQSLDEPALADQLADAKPNEPSHRSEQAELFACIRKALQALRLEDRELLMKRYALQHSSRQLASEAGCSAAAIDTRLTRARQRLAVILQQMGVNHDSLG